jgi:hypothetical protein
MSFYAGITKDWVCTRAKRVNYPNKPYSFEVIEIELLDILSNNSIFGNQCTNFIKDKGFSIDTAKILQNVEKSYNKGKLLLEESNKSDAWDAYTKMPLM